MPTNFRQKAIARIKVMSNSIDEERHESITYIPRLLYNQKPRLIGGVFGKISNSFSKATPHYSIRRKMHSPDLASKLPDHEEPFSPLASNVWLLPTSTAPQI